MLLVIVLMVYLDVIDNPRLQINTDSPWNIIAMVSLNRKIVAMVSLN